MIHLIMRIKCFPAKLLIVSLLFLLTNTLVNAQVKISGHLEDKNGHLLEGVFIDLDTLLDWTISNEQGDFIFKRVSAGTYHLKMELLGYQTLDTFLTVKNENFALSFQMAEDPLDLDHIIVTGTFDERAKLSSSVAITTLNKLEIAHRTSRGTADLLKAIPGTFVDAAAGEIYTKAYSRGISSSAEDDHGWFYVSLQEDGMPITATQFTFYSPDLFHRIDLMTNRLEAIRGGSAAITSQNAPGGIYNFISKTGSPVFGGQVQTTFGIQGDGNGLYRLDTQLSGPLNKNGLTYSVGGFYRYDEGPRNTDFNWSNGGQIKLNVQKKYKEGEVLFYGKYLNDKVNRYLGLSAKNWENPEPVFGHNFNTSAVMLPNVSSRITNGQLIGATEDPTQNFDTNKGVKTKEMAIGVNLKHYFKSGWALKTNFKFTSKNANWQSSIANYPLGLESVIPYCLSSFAFAADPNQSFNRCFDFGNGLAPFGEVVFQDAQTGEIIARVDNTGALDPTGSSFEYLEGSLPNDALLGTFPWQKEDDVRDVMYHMSVNRKWKNHSVNLGLFAARSAVETFTSGSFAYTTFENEPRMLQVTVDNGSQLLQLSDDNGIANHGGLFYKAVNADVNQLAVFFGDVWEIKDHLNLDFGLRYELVNHLGLKDRYQPISLPGGVDGNEITFYDNTVLEPLVRQDAFDFSYDYFSYSLGLNYQINAQTALFARFTNGNKAPELSYYFNNFENIPIDSIGSIQGVYQGEFGVKIRKATFNIFATIFWSLLNNISFSEFVVDETTGSFFFTPQQLNKTTTTGLELEAKWKPLRQFDLHVLATIQNPKATKFTIYDARGTADIMNDTIIDYSENELPHNPKLTIEVTPSFTYKNYNLFLTWRYLSEREGNVANAFQLPGFSMINTGISGQFSKHFYASFTVNNLLNSKGLMNFFGPNEFGGNASAATATFIAENPDASFVVVPVLPRSLFLKIGYQF